MGKGTKIRFLVEVSSRSEMRHFVQDWICFVEDEGFFLQRKKVSKRVVEFLLTLSELKLEVKLEECIEFKWAVVFGE